MTTKDSQEMTAKSVEEAVELGLRELGASREEVEVDVISRGRTGILGIGGEPARVRLTRLPASASVAAAGIEMMNRLIGFMGVQVVATISNSGESNVDTAAKIEIEGDDSGLLIGRKGETLRALQFVLNFLLTRRLQERVWIDVDVEGYLERRDRSLKILASRMAEKAIAKGHVVTLDPMTPRERRVVHLALADHSNVETASVGEGDGRKVTILPKDSA